MDDLSVLITAIEYKTHQLIKQLQQLKDENIDLKNKIELLTQKDKENTEKIKFLEEKNKILKIARTLKEDEQKTTNAKLKINEILREVDRCIALLNK